MKTIMIHSVPKIFSSYAAVLGQWDDGTTGARIQTFIRQTKYHCHCCNTDFIVSHRWHGGLYYGGQGFGDFIVYCPYCGHRHENFTRRRQIYNFDNVEFDSSETAPLGIEMSLIEYRKDLLLRVKAKTLATRKERGKIKNHFGSRIEEIRFDIESRLTTFSILSGSHRSIIKQYAIGNPFNADFYRDSVLLQIRSDNLSEQYKEGTVALLKMLRDSIRRKWREIHSYDIGSLFVSCGKVNGRMLFPLMNLAFRLKFPDAPNLPGYLNVTLTELKTVKTWRMVTEEAEARYNVSPVVIKGKDSVSAIIEIFGLPNRPSVRKLLTKDFFTAPELETLFRITSNLNYAIKIRNILQEKIEALDYHYYGSYRCVSEVYELLLEIKDHYPTPSIIAMLKREDLNHIIDIQRMLHRLSDERRTEAWCVRLKELHDWLVIALKEQEEKGRKLNVPEPVKRRLAMQLGSVKFFLPKHTDELAIASDELHNCVRTYANRVLSGICNIVLMTDDRGKLVACLEVAGGRLVQAKLKHNKRVSEDATVNRAVVDWCEKAKLEIATPDVSTETQNKSSERIAG